MLLADFDFYIFAFQKLKPCFSLKIVFWSDFWHHNILITLMQSMRGTSWYCVWFQIHGTTAVVARTNRINTSRTLQQKLKSLPGKTALPQISTSGKDEQKNVCMEGKKIDRFFISINCHRLNLQKKYIHSTCSHLTTTIYWLLKTKCFNWSMIYGNL